MVNCEPDGLVGLISSLPTPIQESILELGFFVQEFQDYSGITFLSLVENPESHYGSEAAFDCSDCSETKVGLDQNFWQAEDFESTFGGICNGCAMRYFSDGYLVGLSNEAFMQLLMRVQKSF